MERKIRNKDPLGRGLGCHPYVYTMLSIAGILTFFFFCQLLLVTGVVSDRYISKPTELFLLLIRKFSDKSPDGSTLPIATLASLKVAVTGLVLAIVTGVPLGLIMGWYKGADRFFSPIFEVLRPIPPVSWIPLTIVWLGIGLRAKAFIIFFAAFITNSANSCTELTACPLFSLTPPDNPVTTSFPIPSNTLDGEWLFNDVFAPAVMASPISCPDVPACSFV